jgi:hypothetical protein
MSSELKERRIDLSGDVHGFFTDLLERAIEERGVNPGGAVSTYLSGLLADYARPDMLNAETFERPFTLLLAEALESRHSERFERLRTLGDAVLYVRGFFSDHLETRGVALGYVSSVGARAYDGAATVLRRGGHWETASPDVFGALAASFDDFVEVLEAVADSLLANSNAATEEGVLKLYERWLKTGSGEIERALVAKGLVPMRGLPGIQ